jgi:hypothetical protein
MLTWRRELGYLVGEFFGIVQPTLSLSFSSSLAVQRRLFLQRLFDVSRSFSLINSYPGLGLSTRSFNRYPNILSFISLTTYTPTANISRPTLFISQAFLL